MSKLTACERLVRAAQRGTGLRLTAEEVWSLGCSDPIKSAAEQDKKRREQEEHHRKSILENQMKKAAAARVKRRKP